MVMAADNIVDSDVDGLADQYDVQDNNTSTAMMLPSC